jgi:hypothetical protein
MAGLAMPHWILPSRVLPPDASLTPAKPITVTLPVPTLDLKLTGLARC